MTSPNPDELLHPAYQPFTWYVTNTREELFNAWAELALSPGPIPSFSMLHAELAILKGPWDKATPSSLALDIAA